MYELLQQTTTDHTNRNHISQSQFLHAKHNLKLKRTKRMIRVITILIAIFQFSNAYDTSSYYSSSRSKNEEKNVVEDADKIVDELWYAFNEGRRVRSFVLASLN